MLKEFIALGPFDVARLVTCVGLVTHRVINKMFDTIYIGTYAQCNDRADRLNDEYAVYAMAKGTEAEKLL